MRVAYFDCIGGISGDMTIAAFVDAGLEARALKAHWDRLNLGNYRVQFVKVKRGHLSCTKFNAIFKNPKRFRSPQQLIDAVKKSNLTPAIQKCALEIIEELIAAEEVAHNQKRSDLHLHQLADADTLMDAVGVAVALQEFKISRCYVSDIKLGSVAPATLNILKGFPVHFKNSDYEMITPTGAAIIKALVKKPSLSPPINVEEIGYGAGAAKREERLNVLRVAVGATEPAYYARDSVYVVQTAVDDMLPLAYENLFQKLFTQGALDAYVEPIQMKKSRPGILLTVLTPEFLLQEISKIIFQETTTFGIRYYRSSRLKLKRKIFNVNTVYGKLSVKVGYLNSKPQVISPEYRDCKRAALKYNTRFLEVYESAKQAAAKALKKSVKERR